MQGIKIHKRIVSICIALILMVTAYAVPISTKAATVPVTVKVAKEGQVVDTMTYKGVKVNAIYIPRNDSNTSEMWDDPVYCCAALIKKFYLAVYGCTVYNLWPGSTPLCDAGYFTKVKTPQVGDIYGNSSHWAIVKQINGSEVVLFEQNWTWYDNNGCYAKYNRTVNLNNLESDVSFFRYSGADANTKPVLTTDYASMEGVLRGFSWTTGSKTTSSTLNIYNYSSSGAYGSDDLISSTESVIGGYTELTLPMGHYAAQVINYSGSDNGVSSNIAEFYVVGQPLASSVTLGANALTVVAGQAKTVTSKMLPENTNDILTWTSSDDSVATVSNRGVVTGVNAGAVTITSKAVSGVKAVCTVTVKPKTVTNLRVSGSSKTSVTLSWDTAGDVSGYRVFRYDTSKKKYVKIADLKTNSYKILGLKKASAYKFKVRAYKKAHGKHYLGKYSSVLTACTRPDKAKNLTAVTKSASCIKLSWTGISGANGYAVYADANGDKCTNLATVSGKKHSVKLKKLKAGTTYTFKVKAIKKISGVKVYSGASKKAYATTKPGKVKSVTAKKDSGGNVTISWRQVNGAEKYMIYMQEGKTYRCVKTVSSSKSKAKIKYLTAGKHKFKIRALKLYGGYKYYGKYSDEVKA